MKSLRPARSPLRRVSRLLAALAAVGTALILAACGSSSSEPKQTEASQTTETVSQTLTSEAAAESTTGEVPAEATEASHPSHLTASMAKEAVAAAEKPITSFTGPSTPPGPVPKGKHIVAITCENAAPLCLHSAEGVAEAAKAVGWSTQIVDGKGTPAAWTSAVETAVQGKADAIVLDTAIPTLIPQALAKAKEAGIPVMSTITTLKPGPDVVHEFESSRYGAGYTLGEWVVAHYPEGTQVLLLNSPEFEVLQKATAGFKAALGAAGPKYKIVEEATSPLSDQVTPAGPQRLAAMMRSHPEAKVFFVMSQDWGNIFLQAAQSTDDTGITGLGIDGESILSQMREGAKFVCAGPDSRTYGWWVIDGLIRYWNKNPQVKENIPFRLIDQNNVGTTTGPRITYSYNYAADWKHLWSAGE